MAAVEKPRGVVVGSEVPPPARGAGPDQKAGHQQHREPDPGDTPPAIHALTLAGPGEASMKPG